ncbi:MAG: hypothetical protein K2P17_05230 [Helicobacteraceae bacterium]|nr:hypothetical protein [Helicobacteraceae bacterium]
MNLANDMVKIPTLGKLYPAHPIPLQKIEIIKENILKMYLTLFNLSSNTILAKPINMPKINKNLISKLHSIAPLEKIILFLPEARSMASMPLAIFRAKCAKLQESGYSIVLNLTRENHFLFNGSYVLPLTLSEAIALALSCGGVVSMRSGFCDIIARDCKNLEIYYPNKEILDFYSLKVLGLSESAREIILPNVESHLFFKVYQRVQKRGFSSRIRLPFSLYRVIKKNKHLKELLDLRLMESYEYKLGEAITKMYKNFFKGGFMFLKNYSKIKQAPKIETILKDLIDKNIL